MSPGKGDTFKIRMRECEVCKKIHKTKYRYGKVCENCKKKIKKKAVKKMKIKGYKIHDLVKGKIRI